MDCSFAADSLCKYIIIFMLWKYSFDRYKKLFKLYLGQWIGKDYFFKKAFSTFMYYFCIFVFSDWLWNPAVYTSQ